MRERAWKDLKSQRKGEMTYRCVEHAIPRQARILVDTMMRLSERDARTTASDGAGIDGVKAAEER